MSGSWLGGWVAGDVLAAAELSKGVGAVFDTTLGSAAATIDTGAIIPGGYAHLMVVIVARGDTAATSTALAVRLNNDSTAAYNYQQIVGSNVTAATAGASGSTSLNCGSISASTAPASVASPMILWIPGYAGTIFYKSGLALNWVETADAASGMSISTFGVNWENTAAVTRITASLGAGNFVTGSRMTVHVMGA